MKVIRNDLPNFYRKLQALRLKEINSVACSLLAEKCRSFAELYWASEATITVEGEGTERKIVASGEQVAFIEFGIGIEGKGTYLGELPQSGVPFTGAWQYYYPSKSKIEINGIKGWIDNNGNFRVGYAAKMPMYNTMRDLRLYVETDFINDLKGALA